MQIDKLAKINKTIDELVEKKDFYQICLTVKTHVFRLRAKKQYENSQLIIETALKKLKDLHESIDWANAILNLIELLL